MIQAIGTESAKTGKEFWLALAGIEGIGPIRIRYLLQRFENVEAVFSADLLEIARLPLFDPLLATKVLKARVSLPHLRRHIDWYESQGIQIITWEDVTYPEQLKQVSNAPLVLACQGNLNSIQKPTIAVVGSNNPTLEGISVTLELTNLLVESGYTIASGLSKGIDLTAHTTALACDGLTCAILPTDLLSVYPVDNQPLAVQIQRKGAVLSEHIFPASPSATNLLTRNRIITGLSIATIIIESNTDSEAMQAAGYARDQGRFVCAIDWGNRDHQLAEGSRQLIKSGAIAVPSSGLAEFVKSFTNSASTSEFQATYIHGEQMDLF